MPVALRLPTPARVPFGTLTLTDRNGAAATGYTDATGTTPLPTPITADATGAFPPVYVLPALWGFLRRPSPDWPTEQQFDQALPDWFGFLETVNGAYQCFVNGALQFWCVAMRLTSPLAVAGAATPMGGNQRYVVGVSIGKPASVTS